MPYSEDGFHEVYDGDDELPVAARIIVVGAAIVFTIVATVVFILYVTPQNFIGLAIGWTIAETVACWLVAITVSVSLTIWRKTFGRTR